VTVIKEEVVILSAIIHVSKRTTHASRNALFNDWNTGLSPLASWNGHQEPFLALQSDSKNYSSNEQQKRLRLTSLTQALLSSLNNALPSILLFIVSQSLSFLFNSISRLTESLLAISLASLGFKKFIYSSSRSDC
jgi:hypothetical protein